VSPPAAGRSRPSPGEPGRDVIPLTAWLAASNLAQLALGVAQSVVLARWLGPAGWGELGWILSAVMVADAVAQAGLSNILVREVAAFPRNDGRTFGTVLALRGFLAAAGALVLWPLAGPWAGLLLVAYVGQLGGLVLRAKLERGFQIAANLIPITLSTAAVFAVARGRPADVPLALSVLAVATLVAAAVQLLLARARLASGLAWDRARAPALMREAWPLWAGAILVAWMYRLDVFLLKRLLPGGEGDLALGYYQTAYKPIESGHFLLGALVMTAFPAFSARAGKPAALGETLKTAMRHARLFGGAAMIAALVLGPWAVRLLFGERYAPSGPAVQLLAPALVLVLANALLASFLTATGRQRELLMITVAMVAFKLAANLAVIPVWSYEGSAAMTTLTEAFGLGLLWWRVRKVQSAR